jgi:hypothetical protein
MKKIMIVLAILMFLPAGVLAVPVTILDTNVDRWGGDVFNVFSITVETDPTKPMSFRSPPIIPKGGTVHNMRRLITTGTPVQPI